MAAPALRWALMSACLWLGACACGLPPAAGGRPEATQRPAERALASGLRAYDEGQYAGAERELKLALGSGLASAKDRALAHKHLAFVYCSSQRVKPCESAFRAARAADVEFALSRAEASHPLWGPVYKRIAAAR